MSAASGWLAVSTSKLFKDPAERLLYLPEVWCLMYDCCDDDWWEGLGLECAVFHPSTLSWCVFWCPTTCRHGYRDGLLVCLTDVSVLEPRVDLLFMYDIFHADMQHKVPLVLPSPLWCTKSPCECFLSAQTFVLPVSDCCTILSGQVIMCYFLAADTEFLLQLMLGH